MIFAVINRICWGAFLLTWLAGAVYNSFFGPKVQRRGLGLSGGWFVGTIGYLIVELSLLHAPHLWPIPQFKVSGLEIAGAVLLLAGTFLALWARLALGVMWSSSVTLKQNHQLHTGGPYRITRHPIYTGMLGMFVGSALTNKIGSPFFLLFLLLFLFYLAILSIKIPDEEKLMTEQFGEQYLEYKNRIPRLIPGLRYLHP